MMDLRRQLDPNDTKEEKRQIREKIPTTLTRVHKRGIFFWDTPFKTSEFEARLVSLQPYLTEERMRQVIVPVISMTSKISLRLLHYFVITYAKRLKLAIRTRNGQLLDIYASYISWLKFFHRHLFDAFRRGNRIYFDFDGYRYSTTVAQLNYLQWVEHNQILTYALEHHDTIENDMHIRLEECAEEKKILKTSGSKRKRVELSKTQPIKCFIYKNKVQIKL
jgi:hypothetical protein